jgi:purine-binding chemotaxis protein CheW
VVQATNRSVQQAQLAEAGDGQIQQHLTFMLGGEMFAMGILTVKEIIEYANLTEVPMMPACIRGVINLRGAVVPVVDLAVRFGRAAAPVTKRTCIVIVEVTANGERQVVGVVVDAVNEVLDIPASEIEPPPSFGARLRTDFIQGMGKVNNKFVILLDVNHVLALDELADVAAAVDGVAQQSASAAASAA